MLKLRSLLPVLYLCISITPILFAKSPDPKTIIHDAKTKEQNLITRLQHAHYGQFNRETKFIEELVEKQKELERKLTYNEASEMVKKACDKYFKDYNAIFFAPVKKDMHKEIMGILGYQVS